MQTSDRSRLLALNRHQHFSRILISSVRDGALIASSRYLETFHVRSRSRVGWAAIVAAGLDNLDGYNHPLGERHDETAMGSSVLCASAIERDMLSARLDA